MTSDLTRAERLRLIVKAFRDCGQEPSQREIAAQYKHETGEDLGAPAALQLDPETPKRRPLAQGVHPDDASDPGPERAPAKTESVRKRTPRGKPKIEDLF